MARVIDSFVIIGVLMVVGVGVGISLAVLMGGDPEAATSVGLLIAVLFNILSIGFPIAYNAFLVARSGATLGKKAMGLKVVSPDGYDVSTGQAWGRAFADMLSQMTMGIGYLLVLFDEEKRALHDHVCSTRVVTTR